VTCTSHCSRTMCIFSRRACVGLEVWRRGFSVLSLLNSDSPSRRYVLAPCSCSSADSDAGCSQGAVPLCFMHMPPASGLPHEATLRLLMPACPFYIICLVPHRTSSYLATCAPPQTPRRPSQAPHTRYTQVRGVDAVVDAAIFVNAAVLVPFVGKSQTCRSSKACLPHTTLH
jgi:hypothetical protein